MATETDTLLLQIKADNKQLLGKLSQTEKATTTAAKGMTKAMGAFGVAFGAAFAIQGIKNIALASDEMVRLNARLLATTGSAKKAAEAMGFLQETAERQSVDLIDLSNAYTRLLPAVNSNIISMGDMRKILTLANDNIKAIGLSTAEAQGVFLGLSQALGSGTVTMEDLRQVTDRLPGSLNRMAKAAGKSVGEYKDFIATGKATADMIKDDLITAFQQNEGAAESMAGTLESAIARMNNSLRLLAEEAGKSGINDASVAIVDSITAIADAALKAVKPLEEYIRTITDIMPLYALAKQAFQSDPINTVTGQDPKFASKFDVTKTTPVNTGPIGPQTQDDGFGVEPVLRDDDDPTTKRQVLLDELAEFEEQKLEIEREAATKKFEEMAAKEMELQDFINQSRGTQLSKTQGFLDRIKSLEEASASTRIKVGVGMFMQLLGEGAKHNKKLFEINKAAGIANAVIYTAEGMMKAMAQFGPILGPPMAGIVAAMGATQIAAISATSFGGGGGGAASPAAASAAAPTATASGGGGGGGGGGDSFINISPIDRDATYTGQQIDDIISGINDRIDSGAVVKGINVG